MSFSSHMMPTPYAKHASGQKDSQRYEGVKAGLMAELKLVESCMGKCQVSYSGAAKASALSSDIEQPCMTRCFSKYFDSTLLVDKELSMYTHGTPYRS